MAALRLPGAPTGDTGLDADGIVWSPLYVAFRYDCQEAGRFLVARGANPERGGRNGALLAEVASLHVTPSDNRQAVQQVAALEWVGCSPNPGLSTLMHPSGVTACRAPVRRGPRCREWARFRPVPPSSGPASKRSVPTSPWWSRKGAGQRGLSGSGHGADPPERDGSFAGSGSGSGYARPEWHHWRCRKSAGLLGRNYTPVARSCETAVACRLLRFHGHRGGRHG